MKVLLISGFDWANVGKSFEIALKSVGEEAKSICFDLHSLLPEEHSELVNSEETLREYLTWCDIILLMHSASFKLNTNKPMFVFHGGTTYREHHKELNEVFNPRVSASIIQTYDLLGLGAENEKWVIPPIERMPSAFTEDNHIAFAHYPRDPAFKGSADINYAMYEMQSMLSYDELYRLDYDYSSERVSKAENLKRISLCDVYIESQYRAVDWGVTALEAAAMGKVVITQFAGYGAYENEFGPCPILHANDLKQLGKRIEQVLEMSHDEILALQTEHWQWVQDCHSYTAVGERLKGILCE